MKPLGIYVHIPFCVKKCGYCDFCSVTDFSLIKDYAVRLCADIRKAGETCGDYTVDTVYGTTHAMGLVPGDQAAAFDITANQSGHKLYHDGRAVLDFFDGHAEAMLPQAIAKCHNDSNFYKKGTYTFYNAESDGSGTPDLKYNGQ